jgi:phosphoserine aminotransferase
MPRIMNFSSGPAVLPEPVLQEVQAELLDIQGSGMSILEHSHRGNVYEAIHDETLALLRDLLAVPSSHEVLLLQGGASQQFAQLPMLSLRAGDRAHYGVCGVWGEKAFEEASRVAALQGATVTREGESPYVRARALSQVPEAAKYVHITSNETIHGVQYGVGVPLPANVGAPLVCDMSSDILGSPVDVSAFALLYAGAQKNIGPSGLVVVVAEKAFLASMRKDMPKIWSYAVIAENRSLYNTPPTLSVDIARRVLHWVKREGGVPEMKRRNAEKAQTVYAAMDGEFYRCPVDLSSRSHMNVVFRLPIETRGAEFAKASQAAGMSGLKGHRSVGGLRASLYNAVPQAWASALAELMREFRRTRG